MKTHGIAAAIVVAAFFAIVFCRADTPDAVLHGTIVVPRGEHAKQIRARVQYASGSEAAVACQVIEPSWTCRVAAGKLDLELYSPGFAPAYLWNIDAASGSFVDTGAITLTYGAPITGKVVEHDYAAKGVTVEVVPAGVLTGDSALRSRLKSRRTITDRAGNFAFSDIAPGTYNVVVSKDGYSTITRTNIHVESGREQKLARLAIVALARLAISATPPLDFYGNPWLARLNKGVAGTPYEQLARAGKFSQTGIWSTNLLDSGTYRLEILSSRGERVATKYVDVDGAASIDLHIDSIPIHGQLRVGERPAKGIVSLVWEDGSSLSFRTSAEGEFSGIVTHEGSWRATVRTASPRMELHLNDIQVRRRDEEESATVRIDLPAGQIRGSAVGEDEQPVRAASVMLLRDGTLIATTATADDGTFSFAGIENGAIQLNAAAKGFSSGYAPVTVDDDHVSPIKLVLHSLDSIHGHVLDSAGNAVLGATVRYGSSGQRGQTATGLAGDFSVAVPKDGGVIEIAVIAPGYPRKFMTVQAPQSGVDPPELRITLGASAARLDVDISRSDMPWPTITSAGTLFLPLFELFLPRPGGPPAELRYGGYTFDVEPGTYTICGSGSLPSRCVTKTIPAAGMATFTNPSGQQWQ